MTMKTLCAVCRHREVGDGKSVCESCIPYRDYDGKENRKPVDSGGPAFPGDHTAVRYNHGMTLRQWYAGLAMQGMLAYSHIDPMRGNWHENSSQAQVAEVAFAYADAMVAKSKEKQ